MHTRDLWATQKTATQLYIEHSSGRSTLLHSDISTITGICLNERHIIITNNRTIAVYKVTRPDEFQDVKGKSLTIKTTGSFQIAECVELFIWDEFIIILGNNDVKLFSLGGVVLREIEFNEHEGTTRR